MKILLAILTLDFIISLSGMFYWMYKSKDGTLNLNPKSWHFKLTHWMWDVDTYEIKNACPYYWSLVFSLHILPIYIILRYIIVNPILFLIIYYDKLKSKIKLPEISIISPTKKEVYSKIYSNSKKWLKMILFGILGVVSLACIILLFNSMYNTSLILFYIVTGTGLFLSLLTAIKPEWDKYFINILLYGIKLLYTAFSYPFEKLFNLISFIFTKITGVISNACPPIKWKEDSNMIVREDIEFIDETS